MYNRSKEPEIIAYWLDNRCMICGGLLVRSVRNWLIPDMVAIGLLFLVVVGQTGGRRPVAGDEELGLSCGDRLWKVYPGQGA